MFGEAIGKLMEEEYGEYCDTQYGQAYNTLRSEATQRDEKAYKNWGTLWHNRTNRRPKD